MVDLVGIGDGEHGQTLGGPILADRRLQRVGGVEISIVGEKIESFFLAEPPDDIVFCFPIEADVFEMDQLYVEMVTEISPVIGGEPLGDNVAVAVQIGVNQ